MTYEELKKITEANALAIQEIAKENKRLSEEADKRGKDLDRRGREADKRMKKAEQETKSMQKMLIGMGVTQGDISEDLIGENFQRIFEEYGEDLSSVNRNIVAFKEKKPVAEFDIIGVNGTKVFVGETKTKLTKKHIDKFLTKTLPNFKKYLLKKRYTGLKMYGVIGARVFADKSVKKYAMDEGIYLIKEDHSGKAKMLKQSVKTAKALA